MVRARSCREQNAKELSKGGPMSLNASLELLGSRGVVFGRWYLYHGWAMVFKEE